MGRRRLFQDVGAQSGDLGSRWGMSQGDFLAEWQGTRKIRNIKEMLYNSAVIGALRLSLEMPIRNVQWAFVGPEGSDADSDPGLALLDDSLANMRDNFVSHVIDALLFPFYGWSLFSITYERNGGRILWRKFKPLGHDTIQHWMYDDDGGLAGVQQWPHLWAEPIPIERLLLYRFRKTSGDPEGESILRPAWISWYYVKNVMDVEGIGIERNLAGLPVITPPMGADMASGGTDYEAAHKTVRNIRQDEQAGVVLPAPMGPEPHQQWRLELLTGGGMSKTVDTNMVISRYEKRMLMAALSQFLMLGMDNIGALATFEGATDFHAMLLNACADIISETFSKFAIPRLFALNGLDPTGYSMEHTSAGNEDLTQWADLFAVVKDVINFLPEDEIEVRAKLDFPEKTVEEIEMARAEEAERKAALTPLLPPVLRQRQAGQGDQDDMSAELYAAGNAPDDDERLKFEQIWQRQMSAYWKGQRERIVKEMK
ncbi:MAG: hypothetical protein AMJ53_02855 [Gammaproteobacteria bacterium SG8_11]|nr:MAG: hypothetical protein AMJ53_02855 [Gammaproteobacteria bacterium SG8_11]